MFVSKKISQLGNYKKYIKGNFVGIDQEKLDENNLGVVQFIGIALKSFNLFFVKIENLKEKFFLKRFEEFQEAGGITDAVKLRGEGFDYLAYGVLLEDSIKILK